MTRDLTFFFTAHPDDCRRTRLPKGMDVMVVASNYWDVKKKKFRVLRPPADHIGKLAIDSGGFSIVSRMGEYPWTAKQYADWIREMVRDIGMERLMFCACMDYACVPTETSADDEENRQRIRMTHQRERECYAAAPDLPWLPVLQGDTIKQRAYDLALRKKRGTLPVEMAGIGSLVKRPVRDIQEKVLFLAGELPDIQFHAFGAKVRSLDSFPVWAAIKSADSANWSRGRAYPNSPRYRRLPGETRGAHTKRLGREYYQKTILPRLQPPERGLFE